MPVKGGAGRETKQRKTPMECEDFLQRYSEFLDGRMAATDRETFEAHLRGCEDCARYDRVVQRGLFIYRNLPEIESSPDFLPRLRHRLYHIDDAERLSSGSPLGSAALVAVAAVGLLAFAWLPFATRISVEVELPPVAVEVPEAADRQPSLFDSGPFLTPVTRAAPTADWHRTAPSTDLHDLVHHSLFPSSAPPARGVLTSLRR